MLSLVKQYVDADGDGDDICNDNEVADDADDGYDDDHNVNNDEDDKGYDVDYDDDDKKQYTQWR